MLTTLLVLASCSDDAALSSVENRADASAGSKDAAAVEPLDSGAGGGVDANPAPIPSCERYCELVMKACKGPNAQYESTDACLAFCQHLPLGAPGDKGPSVACRQYYAGNPALADPSTGCAAAGPFGGGICGDRCTAFCDVATSACPADGGAAPPYASRPDCATACVAFAFEPPASDGGGETPGGPDAGNTLNCRLYYLREAVGDGARCADIAANSPSCQ